VIPSDLHHKILFWGVLRALVMRGFFVIAGTALLRNFAWTIYVFGGCLLITGLRLFFQRENPLRPPDVHRYSGCPGQRLSNSE
jgi:tellurite resistance protein TerC